MTPDQKHRIIESLQPYLSTRDTTDISPQAIQDDLDQLVHLRQQTIERLVIPWVSRVRPLAGIDVLEPGCGCGAASTAFAQTGCRLHAYEINSLMVQAALSRMSILGMEYASIHCLPVETATQSISELWPAGMDAVLLIGVLEHIKETHRLDLMTTLWNLLLPGGLFVVAHTPNRLTYTDLHTAHMPFTHMLPDDIAVRYASRSCRDAYRNSMDWARRNGKWIDMRHSFGTGLSFHDFEIAFGLDDLRPVLADDGMGPEMMAWYAPAREESLLWDYMQWKSVPVPQGFSRQFLNLIFRKP